MADDPPVLPLRMIWTNTFVAAVIDQPSFEVPPAIQAQVLGSLPFHTADPDAITVETDAAAEERPCRSRALLAESCAIAVQAYYAARQTFQRSPEIGDEMIRQTLDHLDLLARFHDLLRRQRRIQPASRLRRKDLTQGLRAFITCAAEVQAADYARTMVEASTAQLRQALTSVLQRCLVAYGPPGLKADHMAYIIAHLFTATGIEAGTPTDIIPVARRIKQRHYRARKRR